MSFEDFNVSRKELEDELREKSTDLDVFQQARTLIRNRVIEVSDSKSQLTPLPHWSGTDAVLGSLDLAIHAMERTVVELRAMLEISEPDEPHLRLVKGDD